MNTISHHNERFAENIQEKKKVMQKLEVFIFIYLFIYLFILKSRIENLHLEVGPYA